MKKKGIVYTCGDHIDTDVIIPARYLNIPDVKELSLHCMEDIDSAFPKKVKEGDMIVAGWNFGCGSSREHAPAVIKECGISCVIARSFARIFYRNAINIGLAILECPAAADGIEKGDTVEVDFSTGEIRDLSNGHIYHAEPFPDFIQKMITAGGLLNAIREEQDA